MSRACERGAWLRGAGRRLLNALRARDPDALHRLQAHLQGMSVESVQLAQAYAVIAREQGFPSWPALKKELEARVARKTKKRISPTHAKAMELLEILIADARLGDPAVLASRPGIGRGITLLMRQMLEARPDDRTVVLATSLAGLTHANPRVRFECAHALDVYGDARCRGPLVHLIDDPVPRVRWMAIHALACDVCKTDLFGDDADVQQRIAHRALNDASVQVRRHAAYYVGMAGGPGARATLEHIIANEADAALVRNANAALRLVLKQETEDAVRV